MEILAASGTLLAGLVFLLLTYGNVNYERHRRSRGVVVQGTIVSSDWQINSVEAIYQSPDVEFVDLEGNKRRFNQRSGTSFKPEIGGTVPVWYDPEDPDDRPVIHEDTATRMFPWIFGIVGVLTTTVGLVLLLRLVL